jgi:hypothetical protein
MPPKEGTDRNEWGKHFLKEQILLNNILFKNPSFGGAWGG